MVGASCGSGLRTSAWRMIMRPCPAGRGNATGAQATAIGRSGSTSSPSVEAAPTLMPRGRRNLYGGSAAIDRQNRTLDETSGYALAPAVAAVRMKREEPVAL